ncbi:uncharacterized protein LOC123564853 [Mercenaria mercenaria]|uniref:uncharacterized protein LOC123564853 n=1 Tax=Mercenaria mercenaria TaxID=6596 RepID=UPI00234FAFEE|nr:uncharacterized protein LOC123564853 [Mercenaria mercenaria]XP_053393455.1 uncharacterized protein LOC123564853 [Mercenaria mercenaria]
MAADIYSHKLSKSKFKNWIKATLGVLFTKEGIEPFVYDEIQQFQQKCLSDICNNNELPSDTTCSSCCTENVCPTDRICNVGRGKCNFHRNTATQYLPSGCPKQICHNFKSEIQRAHRFYGPSYKNTDATQWCSNSWEVAKCFMPSDGYKDVRRAAETDFNGISSVIINFKAFQSKIHDDLSKKNSIFYKAKEVGKAIRHSSYLGIEDVDLQQYFSTLQNLLSDPGYLASNTISHNAKRKLSQLQNDTLDIGIDDIQKVLDNVVKAVHDELRTEKDEHKREAEKQKLELIKIINKSVSAFESQEKLSMSELDKVIQSAIDEIEVHTKESIMEDHSTQKKHHHEAEDLDTVPSDVDLGEIARAIGLNWDLLGPQLGLTTTIIDHIKMDNDTSQKRIYQMLYNWREDQGPNSTKRTLFTAFKNQPSTDIDWEILGQSFPDARKYKPKEEKSTDTNPAEDAYIQHKEHEEVTELADTKELDTFKAYIDKAWGKLVDYMIPDPILDSSLFNFRETRDIMEEKNTSEKNRGILKTIRSKDAVSYKNLKSCLINTKQTLLVKLLECIEQGEDTSLLEKQLQDEVMKTTHKDIKDLQEDLIVLYRQQYDTLPLSPLMEENDTHLLEFYVMPDINSVEIQRSRGGCKEDRSKVTSLHDMFYKENKSCREIYITADAGFGKTALSKRLVLTWCQAKKRFSHEQEYFEKQDITAMSEFEFVFLLSLRDCFRECDIDEMIIKQIIPRLAHTSVTISDLETILSEEKCLVILDGLDEWTHPEPVCKQGKSDIPHRKARKCTVLTTTRPWKFGVSKIRSSEIERKLELVGLSKASAKSLKRSVISLLCGKNDIEKHIQDFDLAVSDRGISDLETIPLLLMYLLCLWCDGIDLGKSKSEVYCQIVELLLKRTFEKYPGIQLSHKQPQSDIPHCFSEHEHCYEYSTYLKALGQLAYETLFSVKKENTLVFDKSMADKYLSPDYLKFSLRAGLLTQSTEKKLTKQSSKVSFSHKTVQEFFCALYICCQNERDIKIIVLKECESLQNILDMSTVFVFISGMVNAEIISSISRELMSVISEDKITSEYRSTTDWYCKPLKDIQDMYLSCMKENPYKDIKLSCQDFFFSKDGKEEKSFSHLTLLAVHNKNNMESIHIDTSSGSSLHEIIDSSTLSELSSINKIFFWGKYEEAQLRVLLNRTPKCVTVRSFDGFWTREMCETLQNNSFLQAIDISRFKMSHDVLTDFLNYIINSKTLTEIRLGYLSCTEHEDSSTEHGRSCTFSLDFSQHSDLRTLVLGWIPEVSQLKVNSHVKHVVLGKINLGKRSLPPEMVNIESVKLLEVNMSASTFRDLVNVVEKLQHKVSVKIEDCHIEPETEFADTIQYTLSSQNFRVTDEWWGISFETKVAQ